MVRLVFYFYQLVNYLPLYADAVSVFAVDTAGQVIKISHQRAHVSLFPPDPFCALLCM
jgi:hypothetical protein